jgi:hypothetical protein
MKEEEDVWEEIRAEMDGWMVFEERMHQGMKRKNKVDVEEIDRVLCAFGVVPWWWFGHTKDLRVVVVVSCYHFHTYSTYDPR